MAAAVKYFLVPTMQQNVRQELTNSTRSLADSMHAAAASTIRNHLKAIAEKNRDIAEQHMALVTQGLLSKEEAVKRLKAIFLGQPVGNSGYIYCLDHRGIVVVHPNQALLGNDVTNFEFVRQQLKRKEGYLEYEWSNPGEKSARPKALYMVYFKPLDWIISVSSYKNEFYELLDPHDFRAAVSTLQFGDSGYAFVFNKDSKILIHPKLPYLTDLKNAEGGEPEVIKTMLTKGSGSIEYSWENPGEGHSRRKIAWFETLPTYGWVVVSSAYLDEIMRPVDLTVKAMYLAILLVFIVAGVATYFLSGRLSRPIDAMVRQLDQNSQEGVNRPLPRYRDDELGKLASEFNNFLTTIDAQNEQLRREREQYQSLFESSPDAIFLLRGQVLIDCNPATCTLFAAEKNSLIGCTLIDLSPPKQPCGQESYLLAEQYIKQSMESGIHTFEWLHQTTGKTPFHAEVRLKPFGFDGGKPLLVAFVRDISERKRSEESLLLTQFTFDNASIGIFRSGVKAEILNVNECACKWLGYTKEELCRMTLLDIDPTFSLEKWDELQNRRMSEGEISFETMHRARDGRTFPVRITSSPLKYKGELYSISFVTDITDEKNKEKQKTVLENHFRQAQRMEALGTLAGGIAHDFNNILSAIIGYTELSQLACPDNPKVQSHLLQLRAASGRAKNLVQQILSFSRQTGVDKQPIDIARVIGEALSLIRVSLPSTIEIHRDIDQGLGTVCANETQIHQIVMNLCANASYAMGQAGGVLEIELCPIVISNQDFANYPDLTPGKYLKLAVSDSGHGISAEGISKIFDPYYTTKPVGEGTGLGLATVHGIVKDHEGCIKVYSELDRGTTFQVFLPLIEDETSCYILSESEIPGGNETILFVDDEKMLIEIGREILEGLGYSVETRASAIDAYEAFRAHPEKYDLVVSDLTMPKLTGEDLAHKIRQISPHVPIILCTGYSTRLDTERLERIGLKKVLMKPVTLVDLALTVRAVLDESAAVHDRDRLGLKC